MLTKHLFYPSHKEQMGIGGDNGPIYLKEGVAMPMTVLALHSRVFNSGNTTYFFIFNEFIKKVMTIYVNWEQSTK